MGESLFSVICYLAESLQIPFIQIRYMQERSQLKIFTWIGIHSWALVYYQILNFLSDQKRWFTDNTLSSLLSQLP